MNAPESEKSIGAIAHAAPSRKWWQRFDYWLAATALVLVTAYLTSGVYVVNTDEHGVVRRFGAVSERVGPGMHYRLPWPIERVDVVKTTSVTKVGIGFTLTDNESEPPSGIELLTGDTNILNIAVVVQYVIGNATDYLLQADKPQELVGMLAQSALTQTVVGMPIDDVLTTGRLDIQSRVKLRTQELLDRYGVGIQLASVSIQSITLDKAVAQSFQDVAAAMADREKAQNEARAYANDQIPKARGEAHQRISEAQSYKQQRVAEAIGASGRFVALLEEYEKAPEVTRSRIYLEAMEKILPRVKMVVIDSQNGRAPVNLRVSAP
ncbi:MAG TPA: FtsH protease activity modulator HflK [Burkholderiales bacterium]|nr:FtsH protease activity modulator HflK [Burkholderiales bacterium]